MPIKAIAFELAMFSWKEGTYPEWTHMEYLTREISLNSVIFRYKEQDIRVWFLHERYIWSLLYSCSTVRWSFWLILMWVWSFLLKVSWCLQIEPQAPLLVVPVGQYRKLVKHITFKLAKIMFSWMFPWKEGIYSYSAKIWRKRSHYFHPTTMSPAPSRSEVQNMAPSRVQYCYPAFFSTISSPCW